MATANQLARTAAPTYEIEWRVSVGPRRSYVDNTLFVLGEPVVLPSTLPLGSAITAATTTITLPLGYDTSDYPDSGMLNASNGVNWGWWSYTGKTSDTFTGCQFEHGYPSFAAGATLSAWRNVTDRLDTNEMRPTQWRERSFVRWACPLRGWRYDSRLFMPDCSVLIELRVTPDGAFGIWSDWMVYGLGYVRNWSQTGDGDGLRPFVGRVVDVGTYVLPHWINSRAYGRRNMATGGTVTTSPKLANPLLELLEWGAFGIGTTDGSNTIDGNNDTLFISDGVPSTTGETPGSTGGSLDPVINEVVTQGVVQRPTLQWVEIRIAPDNPRYVEGVNLKNYYLSTKNTVHQSIGGVPTPRGGDLYVRFPDIVLNQDNDRVIITNNAQWYRELYPTTNVRVEDWTRLDGFGDDQTPGRLLTLDVAGDILFLRVEDGVFPPSARDVVAYGSVDPNDFWLNGVDDEDEWDDDTVDAPGVGESIRRSPICTDTDDTDDWIVETSPNPGDDRWDDAPEYISTEYNDWVAHSAANMTNVSPAPGSNWVLDDATNLDDLNGVTLIGAEKIAYAYRDDTTLYNIIRGYDGTTAASHTTSDLVYAFGRVEAAGIGLDVAMTAVSPATGGVIYFPTTAGLPTSGKIWLNRECIGFTGKTSGTITGITRGEDGTTAAAHSIGTLAYLYDEDLGAHRHPLIATVELRRWSRLDSNGRLVVADVLEVWGSTVASPAFYGTPDYRLDWIGEGFLVRVNLTPRQYSTQIMVSLPRPMRLRHRKVMIWSMSDGGRAKVNEILDWRGQVSAAPNGEVGIGAPIRDMAQEVLSPSEITISAYIGGGHPLAGTSGDVVISGDELGNVLDELGQQNSLLYVFTLDGKMDIRRDYFHPRGLYPDVEGVLDYRHIAAGMEVTNPTRIDMGQVIVEMIDPKTGARSEGRYPPLPGPARVVRLPPLITSSASPDNALAYATQAYFSNTKISREFRFETMGPAEYLRIGQRWYVRDTSDEADEDSGGRLWNVAIGQVEITETGNARVIAQEWRLP